MAQCATVKNWRDLEKTTLHDYSHFADEFRTSLAEWSDQLLSERVRSTLGEELARNTRRELESIKRRMSSDFVLLVVGDFKRGKSTLINALLGQSVAPTNVTPETVTINRFRHAQIAAASANLSNGAKVKVELEDLKCEKLQGLLESFRQPVSHLSIDVPSVWLEGLTIVDTPGMGDVLSRFDEAVQNYLTHADSVIYVISALSPLSESEERFLRQYLAAHDFPKLIFAINMIDFARDEDEQERLLKRLGPRLQAAFPQCAVFAISALDELARLTGGERPNPARQQSLESQFEALRSHLETSVFLNRQRIQLDRCSEMSQRALYQVEQNCSRLRRALTQDVENLNLAISECENGSSTLHQQLREGQEALAELARQRSVQAQHWMSEFLDRFSAEVLPQVAQSKLEQVLRFFPQFLGDSIAEALTQIVGAHQLELTAKVAELQAQNQARLEALGGAIDAAALKAGRSAVWSAPWTNLENFQLLLGGTGIGGLFNMLYDSQKKKQQLSAYVDSIGTKLEELRPALKDQVAQIYRTLAEQTQKELGDRAQSELEQANAALHQAREVQGKGAAHKEQIESELTRLERLCQEGQAYLEDLEKRLWFSEQGRGEAIA